MRRLALLLALLALACVPTAALAAEAPKKPAAAKADGKAEPKGAEKADEKDQTNVRMGDVEIRGEYENPDVFYIIPRRKAQMDTGSLTMDFSGEIMTPLIPQIFEAQHAKDTAK